VHCTARNEPLQKRVVGEYHAKVANENVTIKLVGFVVQVWENALLDHHGEQTEGSPYCRRSGLTKKKNKVRENGSFRRADRA